jgi:hypothetical protein
MRQLACQVPYTVHRAFREGAVYRGLVEETRAENWRCGGGDGDAEDADMNTGYAVMDGKKSTCMLAVRIPAVNYEFAHCTFVTELPSSLKDRHCIDFIPSVHNYSY